MKEIIYTGRVLTLEREDVALPNGRTTTMEIVRHRGSVVLIPLPGPDRIVLIRQYRHVIGEWIWELPAGTLEPGEDPETGARRECEEEIGLTPGRVRRIGAWYPTPGFCDELMTYYVCEELGPASGGAHADEDEQIEPKEFSFDEARTLLASGQVRDMKTVFGLAIVGVSASASTSSISLT
ncbi:MAG: NUDIX hydrolase [Acidobacteria bacterium]|nr:MAG: NUDIX hydrolase [Acidobacteriota bacterium]